jgi:hypothetical protein
VPLNPDAKETVSTKSLDLWTVVLASAAFFAVEFVGFLANYQEGALGLPNWKVGWIALAAAAGVVLYLQQPRATFEARALGSLVLPLTIALGAIIGFLIFSAGVSMVGDMRRQICYCIVGTILCGEAWFVFSKTYRGK